MAQKTALLVVDMQVFFESMTTAALPNIQLLCSHFRETQLPIIFTRHGHTKKELTTHPSRSQLVRKWGADGSIAAGSKEWEIISELQEFLPQQDASSRKTFPKIVGKRTYDAFLNTELEDLLRQAEVKRVIVCGVMTDACCDITARSAFNRGFETWLVSDACGSANNTQHQRGLKAFGWAFGKVLNTEMVLSTLKEET